MDYSGESYIGYPCMNRTLREESPEIRANRGLQMDTLEEKGLSYVSSLVRQNLADLKTILHWNVEQNIFFYRCTSNLFPKNSQYKISNLPEYETIQELCSEIGSLIETHSLRFSFHPDHWVKLASPTESVVDNSINAIENHTTWYSLFGLDHSPQYPINIHIGAHYSDKAETKERLVKHYQQLSDDAQRHLVLENDDKESLWGISELVEIGHEHDIPITFDYLHHMFTDRGLSYYEAFQEAQQTWPVEITPITHYSESRRLHELTTEDVARPQAHSEYVSQIPVWLIKNSSVMVEANAKERAVLDLRKPEE